MKPPYPWPLREIRDVTIEIRDPLLVMFERVAEARRVARGPRELLLIVHPDDIETPAEKLSARFYTKIVGYQSDALNGAERVADRHCPPGQGHLVPKSWLTDTSPASPR